MKERMAAAVEPKTPSGNTLNGGWMGFTTRVASGLGLTVVQRGSLDLVSAADARRLLLVCEEEEVPVLGLEGFRVEGTAIVPEMAAIADYSSSFRGSPDRARETIASARRFLDSMTDSALLFELVYAIDDETGDLGHRRTARVP